MSGYTREEIELRLDQALDALDAEAPPPVSDEDDRELIELVETARLVRRLREPADADDDFPANLSASLATELLPEITEIQHPSQNGRFPVVRGRQRPLLWAAALAIRTLGIVAVAGMAVGFLLGGIGGRAAMRVSGYLYERDNPTTQIVTDSSGQIVGNITLSGTLQLVLEMTFFTGMSAGFVYLLFRPWLPGRGWRKGLVVGTFFLLVLGSAELTRGNPDFQRLGSPLVNVLMFGMLIFAFGLFLALLSEWLDQRVPPVRSDQNLGPATRMAYIVVMGAGGLTALAILLTIVAVVVGLIASGAGIFFVPMFLALVACLALLRLPATTAGADVAVQMGGRAATIAHRVSSRKTTLIMFLLVGGVFVIGTIEFGRNVYAILTGG